MAAIASPAAAEGQLAIARLASSGKLINPEAVNYEVISETIRVVTAYNVGDPDQTSGDPCMSASGENLCHVLKAGDKRCAANFVPLGTDLYIENLGVYRVSDRMHRRYKNRVDIAMQRAELKKAKIFGKKKLRVKILRRHPLSRHRIVSN